MEHELCSSCKKNPAEELHECPYAAEICGDEDTQCDCCDECRGNCCDDI